MSTAATALPKTSALEVVTADARIKPTILVVPAETMARVAALSDAGTGLVIATPADATSAAEILRDAATLDKTIDALRLECKRPYMDAEAKIDAAAKEPLAVLRKLIAALKPRLAAWQSEQDRLAREAEAKRQAELLRLEREAAAQIEAARKAEEARKLAAQQAAAAPADTFDPDLAGLDEVAAETDASRAAAESARIAQQAAALHVARATVTPPKPAGVTYRTTLKATVIDVTKLPTALVIVTANEAAIRARYCTGWKEGDPIPAVPGLSFTTEKTTVVATRR